MLTIEKVRHAWPEKEGFCLERKNGYPAYTFLHFSNSVEIRADGRLSAAPVHSCMLWRPGTPQYFLSRPPLVHDWFHFTGDPTPLLDRLGLPMDTLLHPRHADFITGLVQEIENEFFAQRTASAELMSLKAEELFIRLARACDDDSAAVVEPSTMAQLRELRGEILRSLDCPWTVGKMADRLSLSKSRFHTVYRTFYGTSPMDDLIRARVDSAKNALLFTDRSVSSIAESLGYNSLTHFIRQFRGLTGVSPAHYRKNGDVQNTQ